MSNNNYNDPDSFINMLNTKKQIQLEEQKMQNQIARDVMKIQRDESCRQANISHLEKQKRTVAERELKAKRAIAASLIAISLVGAFTLPGAIKNHKINRNARSDINYGISEATLNLRNSGLGATDTIKGEFYVYDSSPNEYLRLGLDDYNDIKTVYLYSRIIPEGEMDDFIRNAFYFDQNGEKHFYQNFNDYLAINGFSNIDSFHEAMFELFKQPYEVYAYSRNHTDEEVEEYVKALTYFDESGKHNYESYEEFIKINGFKNEFNFTQIIQKMFEDKNYKRGGK